MHQEKIKSVLQGILDQFKSGKIAETVALATFPSCNLPSSHWSLLNRIIMYVVGSTDDARGYRQWQEAGRYVKQGSRSFSILAPCTRKVSEENESGETEERMIVTGFRAQPVFRVEDTDGQELDYEKLALPEVLPLREVAEKWNIELKAVPGGFGFYGNFNYHTNTIRLASPDELVFYHELAHSAHHRIRPLESGQRWDQEIVAELSAAALCRLVGTRDRPVDHCYQYIADYAAKAKKDPLTACGEVISDVEKVLRLILDARGETGNTRE